MTPGWAETPRLDRDDIPTAGELGRIKTEEETPSKRRSRWDVTPSQTPLLTGNETPGQFTPAGQYTPSGGQTPSMLTPGASFLFC